MNYYYINCPASTSRVFISLLHLKRKSGEIPAPLNEIWSVYQNYNINLEIECKKSKLELNSSRVFIGGITAFKHKE